MPWKGIYANSWTYLHSPLKGTGEKYIHYLASENYFFWWSYGLTDKSLRSAATYCVFSPVFSLFLCFCWESWEPDCVPLFWENRGMDVTSQRPVFCAYGFVLSRGVFGCPIILRNTHYTTLAAIHELYCSYIISLNCGSSGITVALNKMKYE
jgi:hypothetical protein